MSDFINCRAAGAGLQFAAVVNFSGAGARGYQPSTPIAAGKASLTWTQGTATATFATGHGFQTGDVCDLYWAAGKRCQMTATVTSDSVALAGGHGDSLPADGTAVVLCKQTALADIQFTGNNLTGYLAAAATRVAFDFLDSGGESQATIEIRVPPFPEFWFTSYGTNPFAAKTIASASVSNGSSTAAASPKLFLKTNT